MESARSPYLDNLKAVLVTGVVVTHAIGPISGVGAKAALYAVLVSVLMPAFVTVAGYLSRSFRLTWRTLGVLAGTLVAPVVVFAVIQALSRGLLLDGGFAVHVVEPGWSLWFLLALFWWRLATPVLRACLARAPALTMAGTLAISLASGIGEGIDQVFALGRALAYLPFFALGLLLTERHVAALRAPRRQTWAFALVLAVVWLASLQVIRANAPSTILLVANGYATFDQSFAAGAGMRLLLFACGLAGAVVVATLTPAGPQPWTGVGARSLYVYLWQAAVLYPLRGGEHLAWVDSAWGMAVVVLAAVGLSTVLGSARFARATWWLVEPLRPRAVSGGRSRPGDPRGGAPARPRRRPSRALRGE